MFYCTFTWLTKYEEHETLPKIGWKIDLVWSHQSKAEYTGPKSLFVETVSPFLPRARTHTLTQSEDESKREKSDFESRGGNERTREKGRKDFRLSSGGSSGWIQGRRMYVQYVPRALRKSSCCLYQENVRWV